MGQYVGGGKWWAAIVTVDALDYRKAIAEKIVERGADCVPVLKGNQGSHYETVADLFESAGEIAFRDMEHNFYQTVAKGHGRIEARRCLLLSNSQERNARYGNEISFRLRSGQASALRASE